MTQLAFLSYAYYYENEHACLKLMFLRAKPSTSMDCPMVYHMPHQHVSESSQSTKLLITTWFDIGPRKHYIVTPKVAFGWKDKVGWKEMILLFMVFGFVTPGTRIILPREYSYGCGATPSPKNAQMDDPSSTQCSDTNIF